MLFVSFWFSFSCVPAPRRMIGAWRIEMRIEQIFAVVTRALVVAIVREIRCVVSFVAALHLHARQLRKPLGMLGYAGSNLTSPVMDDACQQWNDCLAWCLGSDRQRGNPTDQIALVTAHCQGNTARA